MELHSDVPEHNGRQDGKVGCDRRADLPAEARHCRVFEKVRDDCAPVDPGRHEKVLDRRCEPAVVAVEDIVRRARRLQVEDALVAEAVVQPVEEGPVRGCALHAPCRKEREQPLERRRGDKRIVRRPAMATDEDTDVADEIHLDEHDPPARWRRKGRAEVHHDAKKQYRRHDVVMVPRHLGSRRAIAHLHFTLLARRLAQCPAAHTNAAVELRGVAQQARPLAVRTGDGRVRERRVARRPQARLPHAVRVAELLTVGQAVAVAILAAERLAPAKAGRCKVLPKGVSRIAHVGNVHAAWVSNGLRQRRDVTDGLPHGHEEVAVRNAIHVLPMRSHAPEIL